MEDSIKAVQKIIGYKFKDTDLLKRALTHSSYLVHESLGLDGDYQRFEFLGDALLELIVTEEIFDAYPNYDEGQLTKLRAQIVSRNPLAKAMDNAGIINYAYCESEMSNKMKSDIFEAVTAAIYLDSKSIAESKKFVMKMLGDIIANKEVADVVDYKSKMFEYCASRRIEIDFKLDSTTGEAHDLRFEYSLYLNGKHYSTAVGKTKREAQQLCCKEAMALLSGAKIQ